MTLIKVYNRMLRFIYRSNGHTPESSFQTSLDQTKCMTDYIHKSPCPCCTQRNKMKTVNYEVGGSGWELKFFCGNCGSGGVVNDSGFHVDFTHRVKQPKRGR